VSFFSDVYLSKEIEIEIEIEGERR